MKRAYFVAVAMAAACASDEPTCGPEETCPARLLQVFVNSVSGNGLSVDDPSGRTPDPDRIDGNDLAWGLHVNVGVCETDDDCPTIDGEKLTCTDVGVLRFAGRICLDSAGKQPGIHDAKVTDPIVQMVFDTLLDPATVRQFLCASRDRYTIDPQCTDCPDGRCVDEDGDGVIDIVGLIPGIVTLTCGSFVWSNVEEDGSYYPGGNQFVPLDLGFEDLGPRLYILPPGPLPVDSDCELTVSDLVKDRNGNRVSHSPILFHTAASP